MNSWRPEPDLAFAQSREAMQPDMALDVEQLLLIVVGAHLRSEISDRPLADRLVRQIRSWQRATLDEIDTPLMALVCTDMWYLNEPALLERPAIVIGDPGVNAASAFYATRLPRTIVVDGAWEIRVDPEFVDPRVCIRGATPLQTEAACDEFARRYLDPYLRSVHLA